MTITAGLRSVAVGVPRTIRTNQHWREHRPQLIAESEQRSLARSFAPIDPSPETQPFDAEMAPYLDDPFRGAVQRHVLAADETALMIEVVAARDAIAAANMTAADVDLLLVCSLRPDQLGPGNAVYLARELGLTCAAWNVESTCSSAIVAMQSAVALVKTGEYRNALIVVSCTYTRDVDPDDTLQWFMGDGAGAFIVGQCARGEEILGFKTASSIATCGAFFYELLAGVDGTPRIRMAAGKTASRLLRNSGTRLVRECCAGAAKAAGVQLSDIHFFIFNTPLAWYDKFCARALAIDPSKTISTYPLYANAGPALPAMNLLHAAHAQKLAKGELVLVYSIGSASNASAMVMRWSGVGLGPIPPRSPAAILPSLDEAAAPMAIAGATALDSSTR
ncbi:MAG TPA: 3-oxoacyl-[acyl-carrier-protein] synthase III C-terminal domain-containing protein [Kofleriaceae bacterium]|nr:3-oxoacyl-[acyl-carrier-protein] synthase III C-terminal domain-containing protein [Kofleriaceae bacterium]